MREDDFVEEEGLDLSQSQLIDAAIVVAPDFIESLLAQEDEQPEVEEGFAQSLAEDTLSPPAIATPDVIQYNLSFFDLLDAVTEPLAQTGPTYVPDPPIPDVIQYNFSFFDLQDTVTESLSDPQGFVDAANYGFDGPLIDLVFDYDQRIDTSFAQSHLTEAGVAPAVIPDVIGAQLSFFDLLDAVGESSSEPNLTEPGPAAAPDLIESVLSEDDFVPEEGLDLSQAGTIDNVSVPEPSSLLAEDTTEIEDEEALENYRLFQAKAIDPDDPILVPGS